MALSTTMPEANARPARLMTFRVRPNAYSTKNTATNEMGMESATTSTLRALRKNANSTAMARMEPTIKLPLTKDNASSM